MNIATTRPGRGLRRDLRQQELEGDRRVGLGRDPVAKPDEFKALASGSPTSKATRARGADFAFGKPKGGSAGCTA
jgi:hypothetical protein